MVTSKKAALFLFVVALSGCAQAPVKDSVVENVIDVPGYSKDQIYTGTKIWIAENFNSSKAVIENDDKESGRIIGNGTMRYPCDGISCIGKHDWTLGFTMRVDMKNEKMKVTFSNLSISWPPSGNYPRAENIRVREDQLEDIQPSLLDLSQKLRASFDIEKSKENW